MTKATDGVWSVAEPKQLTKQDGGGGGIETFKP